MLKQVMQSVPPIDPHRIATIEAYGARLRELQPLGAAVKGLDLEAPTPPAEVVEALEQSMAERGFIVFERDTPLSVDGFLRASRTQRMAGERLCGGNWRAVATEYFAQGFNFANIADRR